jgi:hypothetical protein
MLNPVRRFGQDPILAVTDYRLTFGIGSVQPQQIKLSVKNGRACSSVN